MKIKYLLAAAVVLLFAPLVWGLPMPQNAAPRSSADSIPGLASTDTLSNQPPLSPSSRRDRRLQRRTNSAVAAVVLQDSLPDSLRTAQRDTTAMPTDTTRRKKGGGGQFLDDIMTGKNKDSLVFEVQKNIVHIYNEGDVTYQTSNLKADYMRINMDNKEIYAYGKADSVDGKPTTTHPVFQEGQDSYTMDTITYNINSKKAKIKGVATQQGDGWLIGGSVKKMADNSFNIQDGMYTTCDHTDHPHFFLKMTKAKVIPGKKVVTGPAYFVMEDVPLYFLGIPEGFFPINSGPKSGILMPTYGEEYARGFFIRDFGYYLPLSQHADLTLRGGFYTLGSWEASAESRYVKRYKYSGNMKAQFSSVQVGEKGEPDFVKSNNFHIMWTHSQDPKANPGSTFSASVNFQTSGYNKYSATNVNDILQTQTNSSISYSKNWTGTPFSLSTNMSISQNSNTKKLEISFPNIVFSVAKVKPFKRREAVGKERWYEKIGLTYTATLNNSASAEESDIFSANTLKNMKNGIQHKLPISASFNLFNYINITPAFNYTELWYFKKVEQQFNPVTNRVDKLDPEYGFWRIYNYNASLSASTTIYGMYETRKKTRKLQAVRHTLTPNVGFTYNPNFKGLKYGFYQVYQKDSLGTLDVYSPFTDNAFGVPASPEAAAMTFSLSQTLEMKVLSKRDTTGVKKIKLIDELSISSAYNFMADSMGLSNYQVRFRSTIIKNFGLNLSLSLDPYKLTPEGRHINKIRFPGRLINTSWQFSYSFRSREDKSTPAINDPSTLDPMYANPFSDPYGQMDPILRRQYMSQTYYDFTLPWNLTFSYTMSYSSSPANNPPKGYTSTVSQYLNVSGSLNLTPKTGVTFQTGFDISSKQLQLPSIAIIRDLHCWQMSFTWIPLGPRRSWSFNIGVKAASLADLKYDKSQSMYDNMF